MEKTTKIFICHGKSCSEKFSKYILARLEADKKFYDYKNVVFEKVPCMWHCECSPNIKIDGEIFENQNPVKSSKIVNEKILEK